MRRPAASSSTGAREPQSQDRSSSASRLRSSVGFQSAAGGLPRSVRVVTHSRDGAISTGPSASRGRSQVPGGDRSSEAVARRLALTTPATSRRSPAAAQVVRRPPPPPPPSPPADEGREEEIHDDDDSSSSDGSIPTRARRGSRGRSRSRSRSRPRDGRRGQVMRRRFFGDDHASALREVSFVDDWSGDATTASSSPAAPAFALLGSDVDKLIGFVKPSYLTRILGYL